jgi:hypothetical protein
MREDEAMKGTKMNPQIRQETEPNTGNSVLGQPDALDRLFMQRSADAAQLPQLVQRVVSEVERRELARQWLNEHPDFFRRKLRQANAPLPAKLVALPRRPDAAAEQSVLRSALLRLSASGSPRSWVVAGSLLLGAACGYLVARDLGQGLTYSGLNMLGGVAIVSAFSCGLLAAALSQWRLIRSYLA